MLVMMTSKLEYNSTRKLEYQAVLNLPLPPSHLLLPIQPTNPSIAQGSGRIVTRTESFGGFDGNESVSPDESSSLQPDILVDEPQPEDKSIAMPPDNPSDDLNPVTTVPSHIIEGMKRIRCFLELTRQLHSAGDFLSRIS